MFRNRLILSFALLVLLSLVQAGLAYWSSSITSYHVERGRVSNQVLAELLSLSANKQRLKVWLAQYLLTHESSLKDRDILLERMQGSLEKVNALLIIEQEQGQTPQDFEDINQQLRVVSLLETNIKALDRNLHQRELQPLPQDQAWRVLIQLFDYLEGLDLRHLIAEAIERQRLRSEADKTAAVKALKRMQYTVFAITALMGLVAIGLGLLLLKGLYHPLNQLMEGIKALGSGQLDYRLSVKGYPEFKSLSTHFNQMATTLQTAHQQESEHMRQIESEVANRTAQLQDAVHQLTQTEQQQKRFFADVSHELRTPITLIRGEAEISLRGQDKTPIEYQDSLKRIVDASKQLSARVDELLLLVRSENGALQVVLKPYSALDVILSIEDAFQASLSNSAFQSEIVLPDESVLDELLINIDLPKLMQVLQIILDNAMRYSAPSTRITLAVEVNNSVLDIKIIDQGIGIPAEDYQHLFTRYFRSDNARKLRAEGLGIGLTIAQTIVAQLKGAIQINSTLGIGTTVSIQVPYTKSSRDT